MAFTPEQIKQNEAEGLAYQAGLREAEDLTDGGFTTLHSHRYMPTASNSLQDSADTQKSEAIITTLYKVKEIRINSELPGTVRVSFDLMNDNAGGPTYAIGRIYKNGVAVGTLRNSVTVNVWTTYTEDISVSPGDLVQLYFALQNNSYPTAYCRNFRISYDKTELTSDTTVVLN